MMVQHGTKSLNLQPLDTPASFELVLRDEGGNDLKLNDDLLDNVGDDLAMAACPCAL